MGSGINMKYNSYELEYTEKDCNVFAIFFSIIERKKKEYKQ